MAKRADVILKLNNCSPDSSVTILQSENPPISVLHIQYPDWPDHGVPTNTVAVREILKRVLQVPPNLGPVVVHCRFNSIFFIFFFSLKYNLRMFILLYIFLRQFLSGSVQALGELELTVQFITQSSESSLGTCLLQTLLIPYPHLGLSVLEWFKPWYYFLPCLELHFQLRASDLSTHFQPAKLQDTSIS